MAADAVCTLSAGLQGAVVGVAAGTGALLHKQEKQRHESRRKRFMLKDSWDETH